MRKSMKTGGILLLGCAVILSAAMLPKTYAAEAINTAADCSIGFSIGGTYKDLAEVPVTVDLYKVADVSARGDYTEVGGFDLDLGAISDQTTAQEWETKAEAAAAAVESGSVQPAASVEITGGTGTAQGLDTGMYLVAAQTAQTDNYEYTFTPYLISLPNNYYYSQGSDEWVYDVRGTELKPEQAERYGSLEIDKELVNFNASGSAQTMFIFQVDITTPAGETESRQEAMTFTGAGSSSLVIDEIPAGSDVTVTEVYSGAGYQLTADSAQAQETQITAEDTAAVSFRNEHNGSTTGGYGVVNNYKVDENGAWQWTQAADSAQ